MMIDSAGGAAQHQPQQVVVPLWLSRWSMTPRARPAPATSFPSCIDELAGVRGEVIRRARDAWHPVVLELLTPQGVHIQL
jgi:hypothetical protein